MAINAVDKLGRAQEKIELSPSALKAIMLTLSLTAITLAVGFYSVVTMPDRYSRQKIDNIASQAENYPVGSAEYYKIFESAPKKARESAIKLGLIVSNNEGLELKGYCSGGIVDFKKVSWQDPNGVDHYGSLYSGITALHCFGNSDDPGGMYQPDIYQVTTPKNIFEGDLSGESAVGLPYKPIDGMTDGAMFAFVVENGGIEASPMGIDSLRGKGELDPSAITTAVTFATSAVDNYPYVITFTDSGLPVREDNQGAIVQDLVPGESGSVGFAQNGITESDHATGLTVSHNSELPMLGNYSYFPDNIRDQMTEYINTIVTDNGFQVFAPNDSK